MKKTVDLEQLSASIAIHTGKVIVTCPGCGRISIQNMDNLYFTCPNCKTKKQSKYFPNYLQ